MTPAVRRALFAGLMILGAIGLVTGWRVFWFLTDDAFIAFRYVSNSMAGHGYVWNPPPFLPVEGYTSFLWVALLDGVWRLTGVEPPDSANWISLCFSYGTLVLSSLMLMRMNLPESWNRWRLALVGLLLAFLLLNRSFLAWSSSGLETAMFCFFVTLWVYLLLVPRRRAARAFGSALAAAMLALTRPDGLLFCAATALVVVGLALSEPGRRTAVRTLLGGLLPLSLPVAHLLWRFSFYGAWLPNTYYAKFLGAWPECGARYAFSFILEFALWLPLAVIACAAALTAAGAASRLTGAARSAALLPALKETLDRHGGATVAVATLVFHLGYYTFVIGGDHFEYRVYNQIIPFCFIAFVWALARCGIRPVPSLGLALAGVLLSLPLPWTHWALCQDLVTREDTRFMRVPVSPAWPKLFRWYSAPFDAAQDWLISRFACMRHQEHKVFWQRLIQMCPTRKDGRRISSEGFPVYAATSVGVPAWMVPNVNVIDLYGLNDYIIARLPVSPRAQRLMAHTRQAPKEYVQSYRPNVSISESQAVVIERVPPTTERDIAAIELAWRVVLRRQAR